jgi:hypothetical protein
LASRPSTSALSTDSVPRAGSTARRRGCRASGKSGGEEVEHVAGRYRKPPRKRRGRDGQSGTFEGWRLTFARSSRSPDDPAGTAPRLVRLFKTFAERPHPGIKSTCAFAVDRTVPASHRGPQCILDLDPTAIRPALRMMAVVEIRSRRWRISPARSAAGRPTVTAIHDFTRRPHHGRDETTQSPQPRPRDPERRRAPTPARPAPAPTPRPPAKPAPNAAANPSPRASAAGRKTTRATLIHTAVAKKSRRKFRQKSPQSARHRRARFTAPSCHRHRAKGAVNRTLHDLTGNVGL